MSYIPPRPFGDDEEARGLQALWDNIWGSHRRTHRDNLQVKWNYFLDGTDEAVIVPSKGGGGGWGGYMGTYDNTKSYSGGQTVRIVMPATIGGVTVQAGLYGVPPGVSVPANGTGNQVPQYPEPTSGTVYWHALVVYCQ